MALFSNNKQELELANKKIIELSTENDILKKQIEEYKNELNLRRNSIKEIEKEVVEITKEKEKLLFNNEQLKKEYEDITIKLAEKKNEYIELEDKVLLQSFGIYKPQYDFANSSLYKDELENIRNQQIEMIKNGSAAICDKRWLIQGSVVKGERFIEDNIKQILKTFNNECENAISKVKFNNIESIKKRITLAFNSLNKLNAINKVYISEQYLELKYNEMYLAYEYAQKVQKEKEELRIQRELHREELKVAKELEEKRIEIEKEQQHYNNVLKRLLEQIAVEKSNERKIILEDKKVEIENNLVDLEQALKDVDYREANQRAGYVYIISNIGAFGKNIYKIGMTRRLDPQDRVDELGSASVPFKFDVHAFIFSDDAPKLENILHKTFENNRVNLMNNRKEFFNVPLEEIEKVVKENYDKAVDFKYDAEAEQYRETLIKRSLNDLNMDKE